MTSHKVKIAARLRPRIANELVDNQISVVHSSNTTGASNGDVSTSSTGGGSYISVTNPRDPSQVFKFPCVSLSLSLYKLLAYAEGA